MEYYSSQIKFAVQTHRQIGKNFGKNETLGLSSTSTAGANSGLLQRNFAKQSHQDPSKFQVYEYGEALGHKHPLVL